jgi:hypothetical protein
MENLYIVDGGIIPTLFTVNPQYGIMVAGEHASDSILADRGDCCGCLGHVSAVCPKADSTSPTSSSGTSGTTAGTSRPSASSASRTGDCRGGLLFAVYVVGLAFALSFP